MRNKVPIIVAVVLGLIAVLAVRGYVKRVEQEAKDKLKGKPVVAAKVDIREGTELTVQLVVPKEVPEQFIPPQAVKGSLELKQVLGRRTQFPIKKGQIILWSDLISERRGGLSSVIPANERAFTIDVSKGVKSGLLYPNDHIDIIATFALPEERQPSGAATAGWRQRSDMVNIVLLQNVTVLAVGEAYAPGAPVKGSGAITVSVTLPEAQLLMFASQHGELGMALRKEGNLVTVPREQLPKVTFEELENRIGELDSKREARIIEIMKGRTTEEVLVSRDADMAPEDEGE